jgi:hypothetical protein
MIGATRRIGGEASQDDIGIDQLRLITRLFHYPSDLELRQIIQDATNKSEAGSPCVSAAITENV